MKKFFSYLVLALMLLVSACSPPQKKGTFAVGDKTFLLNEKPFVIKAAEVHYPRIPREYWEHRIKMCKSLGMNTLCLYVFWNAHEPQEGRYNFTGNNDVAAFCRLAQKHGMYVIVRPGPYVCAEWEMGGLPWWLLKKKDIKLRDQDPYFLERAKLFMNQVGKQLADLQITRGGNIIMVQVENEYGSFGTNKPYIRAIRDMVKGAGFTDVPLFQCDWNSNFRNNALDDLLWTVNFGTGANIKDQFAKLKELRPNTPLMCSEFWSGWFDHWGAKHETRSAVDLVNGLKEMLDQNISFSLYMTHGGTSFGHWCGANYPNFSPTCTSYDYDAPIRGIQILTWIVGIGTLLAGVIGVSNIMLVIIKERTQEIGVMRAIGATPRKVIGQIILESAFITTIAGYIGMLFGILLLEGFNYILEIQKAAGNDGIFIKNPGINITVALACLGILITSGIIAGYIPARKAVKIKPIDALRAE